MDGEKFRKLVERTVHRIAGKPLEDVKGRVDEELFDGKVGWEAGTVAWDESGTAATRAAEEICRDNGIPGETVTRGVLCLHVERLFSIFDIWSAMSEDARRIARDEVWGSIAWYLGRERDQELARRFVCRLFGHDFIETLAILREGAHIDITKEGRTT